MHDRRYGVRRKNGPEAFHVTEVALMEFPPLGEFPVAGAQIVNYDGPIAPPIELLVHMGPDIAGTAGDENGSSGVHCYTRD